MSCIPKQHRPAIFIGLIIFTFGLLYYLLPNGLFTLSAVVGGSAAVFSLFPLYITRHARKTLAARLGLIAVALVVLVPIGYAALQAPWGTLSVFSAVLLIALTLVFFYYAVFLPLVMMDIYRDESDPTVEPPYPSISIILPAYNEEACIGASVEALRATVYPPVKTEIIVVDDGSTDATYSEACKHADSSVQVLHKPNGGKYSALNHGLEHASGEIIVTVDADSLLEADVLRQVAAVF
jgi:biofilm PGA synthesis N-glycosyltransferase PgaC